MNQLLWILLAVWLARIEKSGSPPAPAAPAPRQGAVARSVRASRRPVPRPSRRKVVEPAPPAPPAATTSTARDVKHITPVAWPQVVPSSVPPFPGPEWEPDLPPPAAVQSRAAQLLRSLWEMGPGAHKVEKTGPRWLAYQAAYTGGKKGVVAYRLRSQAPVRVVSPAPAPAPAPKVQLVTAATSPVVRLPELRMGMRGPDVVTLQKSFGWTKVTDFFGTQTDAEVKKRQRAGGLPPTGVVDVATWRLLLGGMAA